MDDGLHPIELWQQVKAVVLPELDGLLILRYDEDVAFPDADMLEAEETFLDQRTADSVPPELLAYGQMVHVPPASILAAQDGSREFVAAVRDEAQPGVAAQKCLHGPLFVSVGEYDPIGRTPQRNDQVVVLGFHWTNRAFHCSTHRMRGQNIGTSCLYLRYVSPNACSKSRSSRFASQYSAATLAAAHPTANSASDTSAAPTTTNATAR